MPNGYNCVHPRDGDSARTTGVGGGARGSEGREGALIECLETMTNAFYYPL